jgi:hypothetical protein
MVEVSGARFIAAKGGHYESWFLRGHHPTRPLAFWIRYTVTRFQKTGEVRAERFGIYFDGERKRHIAVRETEPIARCAFVPRGLDVSIGDSSLMANRAVGSVSMLGRPGERPSEGPGDRPSEGHEIRWDLRWEDGLGPILLLPERLYSGGFPKAKSLVIDANVRFSGRLEVDDDIVDLDGWMGSVNHNWGSRHTDEYAWGQVTGFDGEASTYLEVASARLRVGGMLTPAMTPIVLVYRGQRYAMNALHTVFGRASLHGLRWVFRARTREVDLVGVMSAKPIDVVTLDYLDPSGETKLCINTKLARCELRLVFGGEERRLVTSDGAAFEVFVDELGDAARLGITGLPLSL